MSDETDTTEIEVQEGDSAREAVEAEARKQGWRPKEEWGGKGQWRDASEFLEHGKIIDYRRRAENLERQVDEMKQAFSGVRQFMSERLAEREAQIEGLKARLLEQRADAIVAGDKAAIVQADKELDKLEKVAAAPAQQETRSNGQNPADTPEARAFRERNADWLDKRKYKALAPGLAAVIREEKPHLTPAEFYAELEGEMREIIAEDDAKSAHRAGTRAVEGESQRGGRKPVGAKTFDALPPEAKSAYERQRKDFEVMGQKFSKEDYARYYKWD